MRNQQEVLEQVTSWAERTPDVRAVMLTGSRANTTVNADLLSDYDVEIAVDNSAFFLESKDWLSVFGDVMVTVPIDDDFTLRMVMYKDYVRIDFRIYTMEDFKKFLNEPFLPLQWDIGYKVLSDKDRLTSNLQSPANKAFIIARPSQEEFLSIVTDFWWDTTYVAKSLWRDELFYAKYMLDCVVRFSYLKKMVEWYIGLQNDWNINTNKYGRFFKQYLEYETWKELVKTFSGNETEENWKSLFATLQLFRRLASIIANKLNFSYPHQLDTDMTAYLEKVRNLDRKASDIN